MDTLSNMTWLDAIGFAGVLLYMGGYATLQFGFIRGSGYQYAFINFFAAACVLASLSQSFNLSSALIQIAWISLSLIGITRLYILNNRLRFTEDERYFLREAMPDLALLEARQFLDLALEINGEPGTVLTREGEPISHLLFLIEGEAQVESGGIEVARIEPGSYIGDVTYMLGEPATATVVAARPSRYLSFEVARLRKFLSGNPATRRELEQSAAANLRRKLVATTKRAAQTKVSATA
ncbi:Crp/Fnr family transcriptional regulator [Tepidamorphus sp. 3E244]|uniref:Crp/Fnr family transcriptional regulator n=1 Tax=Tepidamorphus sp. 3E244 TaxID=3385498 RepID=UPI0038FC31F5